MSIMLAATLALLSTGAPVPAPTIGKEALIDKVVEVYGGREALARARAFRQEGRVTSLLHPGQTGWIGRSFVRPGRLRVVTRFPGSPEELRVVEGVRGWRGGAQVDSARLAAMLLQAARLDLPATLDSRREAVADKGEQPLDGKELRVLALEVGAGLTVEAWVDPATGRILKSAGSGPGPSPGSPLQFATLYSDFRKVDGVLFAFREGNWANGSATGQTTLSKVEVLGGRPGSTSKP